MAFQDRRQIMGVGGSMRPFIPPGSLLDVEAVSVTRIEKGNVICFIDASGRITAHRVVRVVRNDISAAPEIYARGDAQDTVEQVPRTAVLYIVKRVTHGRFSYAADGVLGGWIARTALAEDRLFRGVNALLRKVIRIAGFARSMVPRR